MPTGRSVAANGTVSTQILDFTYDATGSPYSLTYTSGTSTTGFYYITNLQGGVVSLLNASGDEVATYTYDPYGRPVTIKGRVGTTLQTMTDPNHIANRNPLRYRGYYYDNETGFYYLQSRYYDPAICRFINADGYASTGQGFTGFNMFAYCNNSPANSIDPTGHRAMGPTHMYVNDGGSSDGFVGDYYSYTTIKKQQDSGVYGFEDALDVEAERTWSTAMFEMDTSLNTFQKIFVTPAGGAGVSTAVTIGSSCLSKGLGIEAGIISAVFSALVAYDSRCGRYDLDPGQYTVFQKIVKKNEVSNQTGGYEVTITVYEVTSWICVPTSAGIYHCIKKVVSDFDEVLTREVPYAG